MAGGRQGPRAVGLVAEASVVLALVLGLDAVPLLRGGEVFRWQWPHDAVGAGRAVGLALAVAGYVAGAAVITAQRETWTGALWAGVGMIALALVVTWARAGHPVEALYFRTVSLTATGPYTVAGLIDWSGEGWHDWPAVMIEYRDLSQHVALSPPGLPLLYAGTARAFEVAPGVAALVQRALVPLQCDNYTLLEFSAPEWAAALPGLLMPLWAALAVVPLVAVARRLVPGAAGRVAISWALVPAALLFAGSWNTAYPALALVAFWLLLRGLESERGAGWWAAAGGVTGLLTFANFSMVPLAGLCGFYVLLRHVLNERAARPWWHSLRVGAWFGLGLALPWLTWTLATGSTPLEMLDAAFDRHLALDRPYLPWLWMHFWEWALLGGVPLVALAGIAAVGWRRGQDVLPLALAATLAALLLSGTARGETGRVWLFLVPFALLAAAQWIARQDTARSAHAARSWWAVWGAQAVLVLALAGTWDVMRVPDVSPRSDAPPVQAADHPQDARFAPGFRLVGWSAEVEAGAIVVQLNWRAEEQLTVPYYFSALPVAPDGTPGESVVWQPGASGYPVTCWRPGHTVTDTVRLPLPEDAPLGDWFISLAAFARVDAPGETVAVQLADGTSDRQIGLGPVPVPES